MNFGASSGERAEHVEHRRRWQKSGSHALSKKWVAKTKEYRTEKVSIYFFVSLENFARSVNIIFVADRLY